MSTLTKLNAWQILGAHALRSATGAEDEMVALDALTVVANGLGLAKEGEQLGRHAQELRRVFSMRVELREYFDGQMKLPLDGDGNGKDGAK